MSIRWHAVTVSSARRCELIDITGLAAQACASGDARDGLAVVYCPHTTAGVIIQEAEPGLLADLDTWLSRAVPYEGPYRHNRVDDNAASHVRAMIAGASAVVPVRGGRLGLGTWQRVLFVELDGPRTREVQIGVIA